MKTANIHDLKEQKEQKVSDLIKDCLMFFAFSTEQFHANKTPLQDGEKYVSIGAGAYLPKGKVDTYINGLESIGKWYKAELKSNKLRRANIVYELNNHEAYYTNDITDTVESLGSDYTTTEVMEVFNQERKKLYA